MPFAFTCPRCRHTSQVLDSLTGTQAKCPTCSGVVRIPASDLNDRATTFAHEVAEDEGDFSTGSIRRRRSGGGAIALLLIVAALIFLGCGGVVGGVAFVLYSSGHQTNDAVANRSEVTTTAAERTTPATERGSSDAVYRKLLKATPWLVVGDGRRGGVASAVVVDRDERLLLTNYHVVNKFDRLLAVFPDFKGNEPITQPNYYLEAAAVKGMLARLVASDPSRDLALLQVDLLPADAEVVAFAPASATEKQPAFAMGAQGRIIGFGNEDGVLWRFRSTRVARHMQLAHRYKDGQRVNARVVEIPALDDPIDFGGPLVDERGRLLGVAGDLTAEGSKVTCAIDVAEARIFVESYFTSIGRRWSGAGGGVVAGAPAMIIDEDNELPSYWIDVLRGKNEQHWDKARAKLIKLGRSAVFKLRQAIRDEDPRVRAAIASVLGSIGEPAADAADDLAKSLTDADPAVRTAAAQALGRIGAPAHAALPSLMIAVGDPQLAVRVAASEALGHIGPPTMGDTARLALLWKEPLVKRRLQYIAQLREMKPAPAVGAELFATLLSDPDPAVRSEAIQAIGDAGPAAHRAAFAKLMVFADDPDGATSRTALAALSKIGPATADERAPLEIGLRAKSSAMRLYCVSQIGALGESARGCVPDIARLLRDPEPTVRVAAATALGRVGKPAVGVLQDLLSAREDREPAVRVAAIEALGKLGREPGVMRALFDSLNDEDRSAREAASRSLGAIQPPLSANDLVAIRTAIKSRPVEARRLAASELARLGTDAAESLPDVMGNLNDPDFRVRRHLFAALAAHGKNASDAIPAVMETMKTIIETDAEKEGALELFRQSLLTLAKIGDPVAAIPLWAKGLKTGNRAVRKEIVQSLASVGTPARAAAKELCATLGDPELVALTSDTLVELGGDEIVRALGDVIEEHSSIPAKLAAVRVVGRMGPDAKDAFQALFKATTRYRGKELGQAARESLKLIQKKN